VDGAPALVKKGSTVTLEHEPVRKFPERFKRA
jgi:hypothetical protein